MKTIRKIGCFSFFTLYFIQGLVAQNEAKKWYFGYSGGLDFMTSPPTSLSPSSIHTNEGSASIADAAGNLLFYTSGDTIWDKTHAVMANGTGLSGDYSTTQSALIVKQPGSVNNYFVFTLGSFCQGSLCVSTVDMSLSSGNGSVTVKNTLLADSMSEKLTAVQHCNGTDIWVVAHECQTNRFLSFLVNAAGVSTTPVVSAYGTTHFGSHGMEYIGQMKVSPDGQKLGLVRYGLTGYFDLYDFDNSNGVISNSLTLFSTPGGYGCEFSPDGSKFYGTSSLSNILYQWDLCAGSNSAIAATRFTVSGGYPALLALQSGPDGKIYVSPAGTKLLPINSPNLSGNSCNLDTVGLILTSGYATNGLPNFITSLFKPPLNTFSFTSLSCGVVTYSAPVTTGTMGSGCTATTYSDTGLHWNFGDPASGIRNTSNLIRPSHTYLIPGTYTTELTIQWKCRADTFRIPVVATSGGLVLSVAGETTVCNGDQRIYTANGAQSYTWTSTIHTPTVALAPSATNTYTVSGSSAEGCVVTHSFSIVVSECTENEEVNSRSNMPFYPNPFAQELIGTFHESSEIIIYNSMGKCVYESKLEAGEHRIDLSPLYDGIYLIKTIGESGIKTKRMVKLNR